MAASTAMFRPGVALDPCYAAQRIYDSPESTRSKKWSSRLKLNTSGSSKTSDKSPESPYMYGTISAPGGSALSKSMKYAETWLYGSVRTQTPPMRPSVFSAYPEVPGPIILSAPQKPTPHNYAVILCSCPEYLNGTKRSNSTKVSICKKCKGSRLPLTIAEAPRLLVGGTVRGPQISRDSGVLRSGTVRVQNSKSRPSILGSQNGENDPYDLMRRSRLAPPHEARVGSQFSTSRSRAKSISPCRVKTRRPSPSSDTLRKSRSKSITRINDLWVEDIATESKKSILSCDINPYDLVKKSERSTKSLTAFDDDYTDLFNSNITNGNVQQISQSSIHTNIKAIGGQRIRIYDEVENNAIGNVSVYDSVKRNYDLKKYDLKTRDISSALPNIKNDIKKGTFNKTTNKKLFNGSPINRIKQKSSSPKRPPRRQRNSRTDDDSESDNQRLPEKPVYKRTGHESSKLAKYKNTDNIKSILKKPKSNEIAEKYKSDYQENTFESRRVHSSQFYLPKPKDKTFVSSQNIIQRKRVQFLVENDETKIIYTAEFNLTENTVTNISDDANLDAEDDIVAEGDVVSHSLNNSEKGDVTIPHTSTLVYEGHESNNKSNESRLENSKEGQHDKVVSETTQSPSDNDVPKVGVLRRSESERLVASTLSISPPKFLDTMALRSKNKYGHTSQVFLSSNTEDTVGKDENNHTVKFVNNSQNTYPVILHNDYSNNESGNISDSSDITKEVLNNLRQHSIQSPEPPPRLKFKDRAKVRKNNYVKTRFIRNNSNSSTSDEYSDPNDYEQKTILRVKQCDVEGSSNSKTLYGIDEIHHQIDDEAPRRTSIHINGSDCYSTMNVTNDSAIYLSSVVVNEEYDNSCNHYQSGTTVTISVGTGNEEVKKSKSQIYIGAAINNSEKRKDDSNTYEEYCNNSNVEYKEKQEFENNVEMSIKKPLPDIDSFLRDPVEAVKRNLIPHVCGKQNDTSIGADDDTNKNASEKSQENGNFVDKLFDDPFFGHLAEGLDSSLVQKLIENSLIKLQENKYQANNKINNNEDTIEKLVERSLSNINEENIISTKNDKDEAVDHTESLDSAKTEETNKNQSTVCIDNDYSCSAPYESMEYESGAIGMFSDHELLSDCYNASASELSTEDDTNSTRSKFYQMLVDAALCEIDIANNTDDDHHYESIRLNSDPIYEEISDMPPPLPVNPPPSSLTMLDDEKRNGSRSIFEGASKYDILSYLVDAKERGIDDEETYITSYRTESENSLTIPETPTKLMESHISSATSQLSNTSDSSEDNSLIINHESLEKVAVCKKTSAEIERNDSGVGSETSKSSRSRLQGKTSPCNNSLDKDSPIHLCEDCDTSVEIQTSEQGSIYAPLVCRKCAKKRAERKEIITEIVETEEKYGRDLQIILEEFYKPMLVAGLLTQEQLSAIFLNVEDLIENNQILSEKLRDGLEIAIEQGDEDLLTVNVGKILLECSGMLTAFQAYCVKQAGAALLLAGLEKEKELLRIFLRVSQMENAVLRRMNLNSFLMVPVQRVTKYPLLLSRLHRATASCASEKEDVKSAQRCVEARLEEMNAAAAAAAAAARDVPLWRRLAAAKRTAHDLHVADIRLRKMAVDVLDWNHDDARFAMEGKLLFTQPNDNNWRKGRTIKLTPINALLVTNGKPSSAHKCIEREPGENLFPRSGVREAALLLVREKAGRYTLQREPLFLDRCVVAADHEPEHFFEVHEITTKDSYIFKSEESSRTRTWYRQLQYHAQGAGAWRKRRNALANIMINPMLTRN